MQNSINKMNALKTFQHIQILLKILKIKYFV